MRVFEIENDMNNTNKSPVVIMLVGPPASGKSTWTEKFLSSVDDKSNWVILGTDRIIDDYAEKKGITYTDAFNQLNRKETESKFKNQLREAFNKNLNIIWDQTNVAPNARRKKLAMIPKHYDVKAVAFEVDRDELNRRLTQRHTDTGKYIPDTVVDNMIKDYVRPTKAEGFSSIQVVS